MTSMKTKKCKSTVVYETGIDVVVETWHQCALPSGHKGWHAARLDRKGYQWKVGDRRPAVGNVRRLAHLHQSQEERKA